MAPMTEQEKAWSLELERHGYERIRDDMASGGHRLVGGPPEKRKFAASWVRRKEKKRAAAEWWKKFAEYSIGIVGILVAIIIAWAQWGK